MSATALRSSIPAVGRALPDYFHKHPSATDIHVLAGTMVAGWLMRLQSSPSMFNRSIQINRWIDCDNGGRRQ